MTYLEKIKAAGEGAAERQAQRLAEERWLAGELAGECEMLARFPRDPHYNLRALEIINRLYDLDTEDLESEYRSEIGRYGIDRDGYPLTYHGDGSNEDREYIPLSVDLERFREGVGQ